MEDSNLILRELGLTDAETQVYLLLLSKGAITATNISRETKLNRSNLYRVLERLIEKKLVFSSLIEKTKYFSVTRAERLKEMYNEKITSLKEKEKEIQEFIKQHENQTEINIPGSEFAVEVYEGINEIKRILENILSLKKWETVYALGKEGLLADYPGIKYWFESFIRNRIAKKIRFVAVYNTHENAHRAKSKITEIRYANLKNMGNIEISFYRETLLIYIIVPEKPKVVLIKSKEIVAGMLSYFSFLWEKAKIV